ncbi:hypothetical protein OsJ_35378 [Oryza sativa Japonica Group]|uniref:Uncharacterized protein n=1 Tax=Oryza sativa subsp. japonica TaxID=39947 RepID=B9GC36_ORYSJ|nr:hypothetical protein OsJ_35378 [Oryza sativa Japonica Group]
MATANNPGPLDLVPGFSPEDMDNPIHNAALSYVSYDRYVLDTSEVYFDDCIPLESYLNIRPMIIRNLFLSEDGSVPEDIQHLLNLILHEFDKREIFHFHGSLVSLANVSLFFKSMYDHIRFVMPPDDLRAILTNLPYADVWESKVKTNRILKKPYDFNPDGRIVPADKPSQTCLNKRQREFLHALGLTPIRGQKSLTPDQIALIETLFFFDFLRNRTSHRMDPWRSLILGYNAVDSEELPPSRAGDGGQEQGGSLLRSRVRVVRSSRRRPLWVSRNVPGSMECWLEESGKKVVKYKMPNVVIKQMMSYPYTYPEYAYTEEELAQRSASNSESSSMKR